jgi:hypothetical protein
MPITLLDPSLQQGDKWTLVFWSGLTTAQVEARVVHKRDLTAPNLENPSQTPFRPQLIVSVPDLPVGPTSITAYGETASFVVPKENFTIIATPVLVSEQTANYDIFGYTTGVGSNGAIYLSIGGLANVCKPMEFKAHLEGSPLRIDSVAILNAQGFFIDLLPPITDIFFFDPENNSNRSNLLHYLRHSFQGYCEAHKPQGAKEVDSQDPNWHLDGTLHVDYSTLIVAITGHFADGSGPAPGSVSYEKLDIDTNLVSSMGSWEYELPEEVITKTAPY